MFPLILKRPTKGPAECFNQISQCQKTVTTGPSACVELVDEYIRSEANSAGLKQLLNSFYSGLSKKLLTVFIVAMLKFCILYTHNIPL